MDKAPQAVDYHLRTVAAAHDLTNEEGRRRYVAQACREVLAKLTSPVELDIYVKRVSREAGVSEAAVYEEAGLERAAKKAVEYSARHSRNTNAVTDGPSQILENGPRNETRDNARRDAGSYLIRLSMEQEKYAARVKDELAAGDFEGGLRELGELVFDGQAAGISTAELMNRLGPDGQSELARLLLLNLPAPEDRDRLYEDCMATLRDRRMNRELDELRVGIQQPGLTEEERAAMKQRLQDLLLRQRMRH